MVSKLIARDLQMKGGRHMDKQTTNPIKVKINGKERPLSEAKKHEDEISISSWEEKLEAEKEIASAKQPIEKEEEFPWLLPDEDESVFQEDPKVVTPKKSKKVLSNQKVIPYQYSSSKKKKSDNQVKRLFIIPLFAISLGVLFGIIALNFLSNKDMPTAGTVNEVVPNSSSNTTVEDKDTKETTADDVKATSNASLAVYVVQGGIFTKKENADTVANTIKSEGFASVVIENNGNFTVYAGLGKDKGETSSLADLYKQKSLPDIEFWGGKQLTLPIQTTESAEQWASSIQELASISALSAIGTSFGNDEITKIESTIKGIKANGDEEKKAIEAMNQSITHIKNKQGWQAQQKLLEAISFINRGA